MTVVQKRANETFTQDEFLKQPALFKYGPRMLWVLGLALVALCYLAVRANADAARADAYAAALRYVNTGAAGAADSLDGLSGSVDQLAGAVESALENKLNGDTLELILSNPRVVPSTAHAAILFVHDMASFGQLVESAFARELRAQTTAQALRRAQHHSTVLPEILVEGRRVLPFARRLAVPGPDLVLVYGIDVSQIETIRARVLSEHNAWLRFVDPQGQVLLVAGGANDAAPASPRIDTVEAGMSNGIDWDSKRRIVGQANTREGVRVEASISESEGLVEYRKRFRAVTTVVGAVAVLILLLAGVTAVALKRFERKEQYLRKLATVDILTELPNRRNFHTLLARATDANRRRSGALALLFVDLDNFKYVNDTLGHEAGDRLLRETARILESAVGARGTVCRLGGDEFTVLVPGVGSPQLAQHIGEQVATALHAAVDIEGMPVPPRASVGVALWPTQAQTASDLMRFADLALYEAKRNGKGCAALYNHNLAVQELSNATLMRELEQAISNNELFLAYQPKFQMTSGALSGFEALVRWQHPRRGVVPPGEFIGAAEKAGLIARLGDWVLERAVRQMHQWHDQGYGWQRVAVNVSPLQLRNKDFVTYVRSVLNRHGVPGSYLQLELTEGSLATDPEKAQSLVRDLRGLGVAVAVDDFGTGYSSLGALQGFELDCLKIDRSFVLALNVARGLEICRAVVSFGHALGLRVIAEGVETVAQRDVLATFGCDEVQGFLYSRPLAPEDAIVQAMACGHSASVDQLREFEANAVPSQSAAADSRERTPASVLRPLPAR